MNKQAIKTNLGLGTLLTALGLTLAACQGGGGIIVPDAVTPAAADFQLTIDDATYQEGGAAAGFKLSTTVSGEEVLVSIAVEDAVNLKALMCELTYDPERYDAVAVTMTGTLDPAGGEVIELPELAQNEPGRIGYAQMLPLPQSRDGFAGDAVLAVARFLRQPDQLAKQPAVAPYNRRSQTPLAWDAETGTLAWYYYHSGDYQQTGMVSVSSLTPIGQFWGNSTGGGPWPESEYLALLDYDSNGLINFLDMTPISRYYGTQLDEYNVYASPSADDYPADYKAPNGPGAVLIGTVNFSAGIQEGWNDRRQFSYTVPDPQPGAYYWVRPADYESTGTPSTLAGGPG